MVESIYQASAPGKVILCGEYAVLEGMPAVVIAIDRRVRVSLEPGEAPGVAISSPGLSDGCGHLLWSSEGELIAEQASPFVMLAAVLNGLLHGRGQAAHMQQQGWRLKVDSRELFENGVKLGLGSSAAMTVALDEVLSAALGSAGDHAKETLAQRWRRLQDAHSLVQGKRGSGIDIAASLTGAVCLFSGTSEACQISHFAMPPSLHIAYIWTGTSASTPSYLSSLADWQATHAKQYMKVMTSLGMALVTLINAREATPFVSALTEFTSRLHDFASMSGLGIFASGHEQLYQLGKQHKGVAYKPCGAGGGDLGLAASSELADLNAFTDAARELGYDLIDLNIDAAGVMRI